MEDVTYINIQMNGDLNRKEFANQWEIAGRKITISNIWKSDKQILQLGNKGYDHTYKLTIKELYDIGI